MSCGNSVCRSHSAFNLLAISTNATTLIKVTQFEAKLTDNKVAKLVLTDAKLFSSGMILPFDGVR